jgi:hypothetical protein
VYFKPKHITLTAAYFASFLCLSGVGLPRLVLAEMSMSSDSFKALQPRGKQAIPRLGENGKPRTIPGGTRENEDNPIAPSGEVVPPLNPGDQPRRTPGTRRDDCVVGKKTLTALIPVTGEKTALTIAAYPTFFFYIPKTGAQEAEFFLVDDKANSVVYKTRVKLSRTSGVMSLSLPKGADVKELQAQKNYRWTFALVCKSENGKENTDNFVNGNIQRVNRPDVEKLVREASPREVPSIYAQEGIWHDLLASLAKLRRDNPNDAELAASWATLLSDVGLGDVAKEPLVQSYSFTPLRGTPPSCRQSPATR